LAKSIAILQLEAKHELEILNGEVVKLILGKRNRVFSKNGRGELQNTNNKHNDITLNINVKDRSLNDLFYMKYVTSDNVE